MGRKRDKIAIGLHDMDELSPGFTYKAVEPEQVSFKPLEYDKEIHLEDILEKHEKGQEYAWILEDEEKYPVITDEDGKVLSFPPIINNQLTEVDTQTTDIFIDVTGKDEKIVKKVLNILATALAERGGKLHSINIHGEKTPYIKPEKKDLDPDYLREVSGLDLDNKEIIDRLKMMRLGAKQKKNKNKAVWTVCIIRYRIMSINSTTNPNRTHADIFSGMDSAGLMYA
jgi:phenylalanyl-tRNA synthetase beta chain